MATTIKINGQEAVKQETFAKGMHLREGETCYLIQYPFRDTVFLIYLEYAIYPNNPNSTDKTGWNYVVENDHYNEYSRGTKPYAYKTIEECYDVVMLLINAYMAGYNAGATTTK